MSLALVTLIISGILFGLRHHTTDSEDHIESFQKELHKKEKELARQLDNFAETVVQSDGRKLKDIDYLKQLQDVYKRKGIIFVVIEEGKVSFWSHNALPINQENLVEGKTRAVNKQNGWYITRTQTHQPKQFIAYGVVKHEYKYQNRYLVNKFHNTLPALEEQFYISDREDEGYQIRNKDGDYLFSLGLRREAALVQVIQPVYVLSLLLAVVALLSFAYFSFRYFSRLFRVGRQTLAITGFMAVLLVVRAVSFWLNTPVAFYEGTMFSPGLYASSDILPSLGDLLLNVSIITIIGYFLFYNLRQFSLKVGKNLPAAVITGILLFAMIYFMCGLSIYLIKGLVMNSHLNLDVNFIFNLDIYTLVGFFIIGLIFFAFFFFSVVLFRLASNILVHTRRFWLVCFISFLLLYVITWIIYGATPLLWMLSIAGALVYLLDNQTNKTQKGFFALVLSLFLFSIISTFALYRFNKETEMEQRKSLALQLASEQDPVAEFLFLEIEDALFNDNQLQNLVQRDPYNETLIYHYLQYHYFYDFWAKYDLQVTVCRPTEPLLIKPQNVEVECALFFNDYIQTFGKETSSERFIYLDNNTGRNSYITYITVGDGDPADQDAEYHL